MSTEIGILIFAALAVCGVLFSLWRSAESRVREFGAAQEKTLSENEALSARLAREVQGRKKQAEELAALRKRADKAKKRGAKATPDQPMGTAARIADVEADLERAVRERTQSQAERETLVGQVTALQTRLDVANRELESARGRVTAAPVVAAAAPPVEGSGEDLLRSQLAERTERVGKLENELGQAKEAEARMRKRMSNQEQLYASIRAELDVKKDRLRTQEEQIQRLEAMKVVVGD